MSSLRDKDRVILLELARSVIESGLDKKIKIKRPEVIDAALLEEKGCFVTLHKKGELRGCIGTIKPLTSLLRSVEENAANAAFRDPRFPPVTTAELPEVDLEISVLTRPKTLIYKDADALKEKLKPGVHGVILSNSWRSATFLPQVWEQLPDPEIFLTHLCLKAGLTELCWKDKDTVIQVYEVEYFSETDVTS